jgi:hypothetical protein
MKRKLTLQILSFTIVLAFLCIPSALNAQGSKANFSGKWVFNESKSNMGEAPQGGGQSRGFGGGDFTAAQETNLLTVESTRPNRDGGTTTSTSKYTLDGKESINSTGRGDSKSVATWSADGKSLTIVTTRTFERDGQSTEMKTTEVWSLTDAKTLSIVQTMNTPNGERKTTRVYDKQ